MSYVDLTHPVQPIHAQVPDYKETISFKKWVALALGTIALVGAIVAISMGGAIFSLILIAPIVLFAYAWKENAKTEGDFRLREFADLSNNLPRQRSASVDATILEYQRRKQCRVVEACRVRAATI